jgi:hypothetical protein
MVTGQVSGCRGGLSLERPLTHIAETCTMGSKPTFMKPAASVNWASRDAGRADEASTNNIGHRIMKCLPLGIKCPLTTTRLTTCLPRGGQGDRVLAVCLDRDEGHSALPRIANLGLEGRASTGAAP